MSEATVPRADAGQQPQEEARPSLRDRVRSALPKRSNTEASASDEADGLTFKRADFVHGTNTGEKTGFDRGSAEMMGAKEITIKGETVDKYSNFLDTYVGSLSRLAEIPNPSGGGNMLDLVLSDPGRKSDKLLMELLSEDVPDDKGGSITKKPVSEEKLKEFLASSDHWAMTTMLLEKHAQWAQMGLGLDATISESQANKAKRDRVSGKGGAYINEIASLRNLGQKGLSKTGKALAAASFGLLGQGDRLEFKNDFEVLDAIKTNASAADKAYLKEVVGYDLDKISITRGSLLRVSTIDVQYDEGYQPNLDHIRSSITQNVIARNEFLNQLGFDKAPVKFLGGTFNRSNRIRLPGEFLDRWNWQPEGLPVNYAMEVMDEYARTAGTTKYENKRALVDAEEKVMVRYLERGIRKQKEEKDQGKMKTLEVKRKAMEENPEQLRKERREKAQEIRERAAPKLAEVRAKRAELTSGAESPVARLQALMGAERRLQNLGITFGGDIDATVDKRQGELEKEVSKARGELQKNLGERQKKYEGYTDKIFTAIEQQSQALQSVATAIENHTGDGTVAPSINIPPLDLDKLRSIIEGGTNAAFKTEIDAAETALRESVSELNTLKAAHKEYKQALLGDEEAMVKMAMEERDGQFNVATAAHTELQATGATEDDIRNLSADELARRIYSGNDEREQVKALEKAFKAKAQQGTIDQFAATPLPTDLEDSLNQVITTGTGITMDQLLTTSIADLHDRLRSTYPTMSDEDVDKNIRNARQGAGKVLRTLYYGQLDHEVEYYEQVVADQDKILEQSGDFKEEKQEIALTLDIMRNQGKIYEKANKFTPADLAKLDVTVADPVPSADPTYSEAERDPAKALDKWYVEWFHQLYPGAAELVNRNDLMEVFYRSVPPDTLKNIVTAYAGETQRQQMKRVINFMRDRAFAL